MTFTLSGSPSHCKVTAIEHLACSFSFQALAPRVKKKLAIANDNHSVSITCNYLLVMHVEPMLACLGNQETFCVKQWKCLCIVHSFKTIHRQWDCVVRTVILLLVVDPIHLQIIVPKTKKVVSFGKNIVVTAGHRD